MLIIYAGTEGILGRSAGGQCRAFEDGAATGSSRTRIRACSATIREKKTLDDALKGQMNRRLNGNSRERFVAGTKSSQVTCRAYRHPAARPLGQEYAADHQGHEDGLGGEAAPRAGTGAWRRVRMRGCCSEMLANVAEAASQNPDAGGNPLLAVRPEKNDSGGGGDSGPRPGGRLQRQPDQARSAVCRASTATRRLSFELIGRKGRDYFRKREARIVRRAPGHDAQR